MNKDYLQEFDDTLKTNHATAKPPPWKIYPQHKGQPPTYILKNSQPSPTGWFWKNLKTPNQDGGRNYAI